MIIGIEAGNSKIKTGIFEGKKLKDAFVHNTSEAYKFCLPSEWKKLKINLAGISSVVPAIRKTLAETIRRTYRIVPLILRTEDCLIPMDVENPEKTGIDRILNGKAALEFFGKPVIIVDAGTAITIDMVSDKGHFAGGIIIPGYELWLKSLASTAQIPPVKPVRSKLIGKNTQQAISSGLKYGISGAVKNILFQIEKKHPSSKLVFTGGDCKKAAAGIEREKEIRQFLTLEGLGIVLNEKRTE
jgi:type III pantothenate kinase